MRFQDERMLVTRREMLRGLAGGAALGFFSWAGLGCTSPKPERTAPVRTGRFEWLDISGSYREIGRAIGTKFRDPIMEALTAQPSFEKTLRASQGPQREEVLAFLRATRDRFPHLVDELEGMAEGIGIPFPDLFAWNCRAELKVGADPCPPGCSTAGWVDEDKMILAHNEDGASAYLGKMFVLRAEPPSGIPFVCLVYPGTIPGNGPGYNARGVVQTTNYISPCDVPTGIPRYFIGRAVLEAENLEQAEKLATVEGRAFPWHHNLASLPEGKLVSLETWPGRHHRQEVRGLHLHTNHLTHPEMLDLPEKKDYLERSSSPRYRVLEEKLANRMSLGAADLEAVLNDHSGSPCKVCRHAGDDVPGATLGRAVFESPHLDMTLTDGPPCQGEPGPAPVRRT